MLVELPRYKFQKIGWYISPADVFLVSDILMQQQIKKPTEVGF